MIPSQANGVVESLDAIMQNLNSHEYLTDNTGNKIIGFRAIGSWIVQITYDNEESSILHCSAVNVKITK